MYIQKNDVHIITTVIESLGIDKKTSTDYTDIQKVSDVLMGDGHVELAQYVMALGPPEFDDFIVNVIYG